MEEYKKQSGLIRPDRFAVLALPIFPGRLQPSIVSSSELNFRVRDGNGWTLALINTNYCNCIAPTICIILCLVRFVKSFLRKVVTRTGIEPMFAA